MKEPKTLSELIEAEARAFADRTYTEFGVSPNTDGRWTVHKIDFKQGASFAIPLVAREVLAEAKKNHYRGDTKKISIHDLEEILKPYMEGEK